MPEKKGFTLAEVLIVLGIIGIIAAMTIHVLIHNAQKQEEVTALKKIYTDFNQALLKLTSDYDCGSDLRCTGLFDTGTTDESFGDIFVKYFKVVKNCRTTKNAKCFSPKTIINIDGSNSQNNYTIDSWENYKYITADGMSILIYNRANNCSSDRSSRVT